MYAASEANREMGEVLNVTEIKKVAGR